MTALNTEIKDEEFGIYLRNANLTAFLDRLEEHEDREQSAIIDAINYIDTLIGDDLDEVVFSRCMGKYKVVLIFSKTTITFEDK